MTNPNEIQLKTAYSAAPMAAYTITRVVIDQELSC
jgi:hypothetical protein